MTVFTYHLAPPFLIDGMHLEGLSYRRLDQLNQHHVGGRCYRLEALTRIDADSDLANLKALLAKQVDAVLIARSVFEHLAPQIDVTAFYLPLKPHDGYSRHILYTPGLQALAAPINALIATLPEDETWSAEIRLLHLEDMVSVLDLDLDELPNVRLPPATTN